MVFDSFGCTPKFIKENPQAVKALVDSYFEALEHDREGARSSAFTIMGADVKQTAEQFEKSQSRSSGRTAPPIEVLRRRDPGLQQGSGRRCCSKIGMIKSMPKDLDTLFDRAYGIPRLLRIERIGSRTPQSRAAAACLTTLLPFPCA